MPRYPSFAGRLAAFGADPDACWTWAQGIGENGYARVFCSIGGVYRRRLAHRAAYELLVGPIADGLVIDHLCGNRLCVNPKHLDPVPQRENVRRGRGIAARNMDKTHCSRGHPFDEANTYRWHGERMCKQCGKDNLRRRYWLNRHGVEPPPKRKYARR